jgi:hypothetical protein
MTKILGIINTKGMDKELVGKLTELEKYNLSYVTDNLVDTGIFPPEQIYPIKMYFGRANISVSRKLELEFKRYMALKLIYPKLSFTPSRFVDMYWHLFMLYTREYNGFCVKLYGRMLNHVPFDIEMGPKESKNTGTEPYERTRNTYSEIFGPINEKIWPNLDTIIKLYRKKKLAF